MKMLISYLLMALVFINKLTAATPNFDIYGVDESTQKKIMQRCGESMAKLVQLQDASVFTSEKQYEQQRHEGRKLKNSFFECMNKIEPFEFIYFSTAYYIEDTKKYTTLDLVTLADKDRMPNSKSRPTKLNINRPQGLIQLFALWNDYSERNLNLMQANKLDLKAKSCPIDHCMFGFDSYELKKYFDKLQKGAKKYRQQLTEIIQYSNDGKERQDAIFILANTDDFEDLTRFLVRFTNDADSGVRNNAMRVIGTIMAKHKISNFDINPILAAMDYPYTTDRNKAGYILLSYIQKDNSLNDLIIKKSGNNLINLLKLKQPNNHKVAYSILKELSHKNYSEVDYASWENWVGSKNALAHK